MSYHAFFLSTRWGRSGGGLNVFNKGLAEGTADVLNGAGRCYCIVEQQAHTADGGAVEIFVYEDRTSPERTAQQIRTIIANSGDVSNEVDVVIVGHDVHTGLLAIECARLLRDSWKCQSAVIRHMHYQQYATEKGVAAADVEGKAKSQEVIVQDADRVFAVGPLLTEATHGGDGLPRSVVSLVPGASVVEPTQRSLEAGWQVFMSGRLGAEDDRIKNVTLVIQALSKAYEKIQTVSGAGAPALASRGTLRLLGANPEDPVLDALRAKTGQYFTIEAQAYRDDEEFVLEALRKSHFAMMPSWHEGFGLTGWEAICAGVPLVCSKHSGLYQFLERSVWAKHPNVPRESIFPIALVGRSQNGEIRTEDIESAAEAVLTCHRSGARAWTAAGVLAKHLQDHYSWKGCARTFVDALEWLLPSSDNWRDRQAVAARREPFVEPDDITEDELIKASLTIVGEGRAFDEWQTVCTALNLLSSRGKVWRGTTGLMALRDVMQISNDIEAAILNGRQSAPIRGSGGLELVWRFLAAASSVASTLSEFNALVGPQLWSLIAAEGFLLREFFYYSCRFAQDFEPDGGELLDRLRHLSAEQHRETAFQVRLGRLAGKHPLFRALLEEADLLVHMPEVASIAGSIARLIENEGEGVGKADQAAHLLWLLAETAPTGANGPRMTLDYVKELQGGGAIPRRWRGDRRFEAAALLASLPSDMLLDVLDHLARDEDESLRWACLDLCFSRSLRHRLASGPKRLSEETLRQRLGQIVDIAVSEDGGHPWLQREFLNLYLAEVSGPRGATSFTLEDFPIARQLLGPTFHSPIPPSPQQLHPEVAAARTAALEKVKRILLVLPPIQLSGAATTKPASHTTTPALGLGLIASALADAGHDVQLVDCHRYPDQVAALVEQAATFDWLGVNVVLSTVRSACDLLRQVRERSPKPLIVVGGPTVNLGAWRGAVQPPESGFWDFEIRGDGERLLLNLVGLTDRDGVWPEVEGVSANIYSPVIKMRCESWTYGAKPDKGRESDWSPPVLIDRRIFRGVAGAYEPAPTRRRAAAHMEAHVVMSKGCDWNCTFCTERRQLSGGERRRDVFSVLDEVRRICEAHRKIHLQFIDDNLLPQIATRQGDLAEAQCLAWANEFIAGLTRIRTATNPAMKWRGIFRIEDFLLYEERIPDFVERLSASGCQILAFGIEHGNETRRKTLKVKGPRDLTNDHIKQLLANLRAAGIDTKGYFILGGHKETEELGLETIKFAIESGVTLAYFALYKDFVKASTQIERNSVNAGQTADEFLSYDQLWLDLDDRFRGPTRSRGEDIAGPYTIAEGAQRRIYAQLQRLGFRFNDLVKYNDYHSDDGSADLRSRELYYGNAETYAKVVEYAYAAFYLRPTFVSDYRRLVADGY